MKIFFTTLLIISATLYVSAQNSSLKFNSKKAEYLYHFAYECIDQEYPNKLNQVIGDDSYLAPPRDLHPAFYGCFDWHSSVHGHWTLVKILTQFPDFEHRADIITKLKKNITRENIAIEIAYFDDEHNKNYERTYGWAWLLKLDEALREWDSPEAKELQEALSKVKALSGLLPICASCKKIRDDKGYWNQIESYIRDHSEADFSHSICPGCKKKLYPELSEDE